MAVAIAPQPVAPAPPAPAVPPGAPPAYEPFDPDYSRALVRDVIGPIAADYFRVELLGADRIPRRGPVILAANHSGNAFPYDGIFVDAAMWQGDALDPAAKLRTVFEPELAAVWWMRPFISFPEGDRRPLGPAGPIRPSDRHIANLSVVRYTMLDRYRYNGYDWLTGDLVSGSR